MRTQRWKWQRCGLTFLSDPQQERRAARMKPLWQGGSQRTWHEVERAHTCARYLHHHVAQRKRSEAAWRQWRTLLFGEEKQEASLHLPSNWCPPIIHCM
eukprot:5017379-Amphidinium_carterae.3